MPRGGARVGAGRPRKAAAAKDRVQDRETPETLADDANVDPACPSSAEGVTTRTPLEYMLAVINDPKADIGRRDRLAVAAAPFLHVKKGEGGKKDNTKHAAREAGEGRLKPAAPPRLVSSR